MSITVTVGVLEKEKRGEGEVTRRSSLKWEGENGSKMVDHSRQKKASERESEG